MSFRGSGGGVGGGHGPEGILMVKKGWVLVVGENKFNIEMEMSSGRERVLGVTQTLKKNIQCIHIDFGISLIMHKSCVYGMQFFFKIFV